MAQYIEASLLKDLFKSLPSLLDKTLAWLSESDFKVKDEEEIIDEETGKAIGYMYTAKTTDNYKFRVKVLFNEDNDKLCDVFVLGEDGKRDGKRGIKSTAVERFINEWINENHPTGDENEDQETSFEGMEESTPQDKNTNQVSDYKNANQNIKQSTQLYAKLTKVAASDEVILSGIYANYDCVKAYSDLEEVLDSDEFIDSLVEGDNLFMITPEEESLNVEVCEEIPQTGLSELLSEIFKSAYIVEAQFKNLEIIGKRTQNQYLVNQISSHRYLVQDEMYYILQQKDFIDSQIDIINLINSIGEIPAASTFEDCVGRHVSVLEYCYPNLDHSFQTLLDSWINNLRSM